MNKEILDKVDEIIDFIKSTDTYKDYLSLKDKLNGNEKVNTLIKEIKSIQKELVKLEVHNMDTKELDKEYHDKLNELNKIPLYNDYVNTIGKLNDMYQVIKKRLDDYFYDKLN